VRERHAIGADALDRVRQQVPAVIAADDDGHRAFGLRRRRRRRLGHDFNMSRLSVPSADHFQRMGRIGKSFRPIARPIIRAGDERTALIEKCCNLCQDGPGAGLQDAGDQP
jgi:hypothetical protein